MFFSFSLSFSFSIKFVMEYARNSQSLEDDEFRRLSEWISLTPFQRSGLSFTAVHTNRGLVIVDLPLALGQADSQTTSLPQLDSSGDDDALSVSDSECSVHSADYSGSSLSATEETGLDRGIHAHDSDSDFLDSAASGESGNDSHVSPVTTSDSDADGVSAPLRGSGSSDDSGNILSSYVLVEDSRAPSRGRADESSTTELSNKKEDCTEVSLYDRVQPSGRIDFSAWGKSAAEYLYSYTIVKNVADRLEKAVYGVYDAYCEATTKASTKAATKVATTSTRTRGVVDLGAAKSLMNSCRGKCSF